MYAFCYFAKNKKRLSKNIPNLYATNKIIASKCFVSPSRRTLRDYRNAIHPRVSFNLEVINQLKSVTKRFRALQIFIPSCFDESKIKSSLVFDKYMDEFIGHTDLGDSDTKYSAFSDLDKLASHILNYYVRRLCSDLKHALAYFATHDVTYFQIMNTFSKKNTMLETTCKLPVITVVSDD